MKKLELKHVLPYVEHNVSFTVDMVKFTDGNCKPEMVKFKLNVENIELCLKHGKLILKPLSELDVDNETHTPEHLQGCCYSYVQDLISRHYDVFGLIPQDLATDINTL